VPLSPPPDEPLSVFDELSEPESVLPPDELLLDEEPLSVPPSALGAAQVMRPGTETPPKLSGPHLAGAVHSLSMAQN
jgi:hypothetical protein